MDEYIKKQDVIDLIMSQPVDAHYPSWYTDLVNKISVADVVPVVHGKWMPFHSEAAGDIQYCSACEIGLDAKMDYCPHCGAKMDGANNG